MTRVISLGRTITNLILLALLVEAVAVTSPVFEKAAKHEIATTLIRR